MKTSTVVLGVAAIVTTSVQGHGRMVTPPHRGFMYTLPQFSFFPPDYDDDGLSAGGIGSTNTGLHGICGDPHSQATPRAHETGGKYGLFPKYGAKAVGACYAPGAVMDIKLQITANHKGYFEFGLCKLNGKNDGETEACFQTLAQPNGEKQWFLPPGTKEFVVQYQLPSGVTCEDDSHCVLRSWWVGGNNADVGKDGQEQFWNCADIYISNNCGAPSTATPTYKPTQLPSTAVPATTTAKPTTTTAQPATTTAIPATSTAKPTYAPTTTSAPQPSVTPTPTSRPSATTAKPVPTSAPTTSTVKPTNAPTTTKSPSTAAPAPSSTSAKPTTVKPKTTATPSYSTRKPTSTKKTKKPKTKKPTTTTPSYGPVATYEQCGGKDYTGSNVCGSNDVCVRFDEWYSQCLPPNEV